VLYEGVFLCLGDNFDQVDESSCSDDVVSVEDTVTADISDGPDGLLYDSRVIRLEELDEEGDASFVDDALALDGGP